MEEIEKVRDELVARFFARCDELHFSSRHIADLMGRSHQTVLNWRRESGPGNIEDLQRMEQVLARLHGRGVPPRLYPSDKLRRQELLYQVRDGLPE